MGHLEKIVGGGHALPVRHPGYARHAHAGPFVHQQAPSHAAGQDALGLRSGLRRDVRMGAVVFGELGAFLQVPEVELVGYFVLWACSGAGKTDRRGGNRKYDDCGRHAHYAAHAAQHAQDSTHEGRDQDCTWWRALEHGRSTDSQSGFSSSSRHAPGIMKGSSSRYGMMTGLTWLLSSVQ